MLLKSLGSIVTFCECRGSNHDGPSRRGGAIEALWSAVALAFVIGTLTTVGVGVSKMFGLGSRLR